MLRLSKMTDYGTVIMAQMAMRPDEIFSASEIAAAAGLAATTASKILKTLARHQLLRSVRGAKGGYMLARPPERISVAEIIAAMEGAVAVTECGIGPSRCAQEARCPSRNNWRRLNQMVSGMLGGVSLLDMAKPMPEAAPVQAPGTLKGAS
ncbi:MAG TPA: SUF system Fe-S cluster assembly regulator [Rhodocyclaceae bacterium]